ncbi:MAG: hypothetical protein KKB21_01225 [Nanoarchaeota archaeon]|nr:hypothetical protein [Nanoarchaeota archaeon]MBU4086177.1 hypothetical protein [Nanoarchaeota archaeon]
MNPAKIPQGSLGPQINWGAYADAFRQLAGAEAVHNTYGDFDDQVDWELIASDNSLARNETRSFFQQPSWAGKFRSTSGVIHVGRTRYLVYCDGDNVYASAIDSAGEPILLGSELEEVTCGLQGLAQHRRMTPPQKNELSDILLVRPELVKQIHNVPAYCFREGSA